MRNRFQDIFFYYSNCCEAHIECTFGQDSLEKQYTMPETVKIHEFGNVGPFLRTASRKTRRRWGFRGMVISSSGRS